MNKKEVKQISKYFFECGKMDFDKDKFNNVFENEWKSMNKVKKFRKEVNSE